MSSLVSSPSRRGLNARQAETLERLMAAGAVELAEVGHEALTVRTVAGRAGVSPATAYTYLASKNHLFAELFWRYLAADRDHPIGGGTATERAQSVSRRLAERLSHEPALAAAVTPALLGSDPDVERLRLRIGAEIEARFAQAVGDTGDPLVVRTITLAFTGALLQAGIGLMTYAELGDLLEGVVAVILRGHP